MSAIRSLVALMGATSGDFVAALQPGAASLVFCKHSLMGGVKSALKAAHETARGLRDAGLMDAKTKRDVDVLCLPKV